MLIDFTQKQILSIEANQYLYNAIVDLFDDFEMMHCDFPFTYKSDDPSPFLKDDWQLRGIGGREIMTAKADPS